MKTTHNSSCPKKEYQKIGFDLKLFIIDQIANGQISVIHLAKLDGILETTRCWSKK